MSFRDFINLRPQSINQVVLSHHLPVTYVLTECFINTVKDLLLQRCHQDGSDIYESVFNYQVTPKTSHLGSLV